LPWQPEDWTEWTAGRGVEHACPGAHLAVVRGILRRLPDRDGLLAVALTHGHLEPLALGAYFGRVVTVDVDGDDALPADADVVLALDALPAVGLAARLARVHGALAEGGVLIATLPARVGATRPFKLGGEPARGLHEVELQWLLRRTGYQGLRLRRIPAEPPEPTRLLCMAVRRALN